MASPWDILGLDSDHRDPRSIKRAYAKLLKLHRPDQDPEGFRRIHEAYQWALRMAEDEDARPPHPPPVVESHRVVESPPQTVVSAVRPDPVLPVDPAPPSPTATDDDQPPVRDEHVRQGSEPLPGTEPDKPPGELPASLSTEEVSTSVEIAYEPATQAQSTLSTPPTPPTIRPPPPTAWELALDDLQHVIGQPNSPLRHEALLAVLRRLAGLVTQRLGEPSALMPLLDRHFPEGKDGWYRIFTDDDLFADLSRGASDVTLFSLRGAFVASDWDRLRLFARRWLDAGDGLVDQQTFMGITRMLAIWLAIVDYELAQSLLHRIPVQALRFGDEELDHVMALGLQAREMPEPTRRYICDLLRGSQVDQVATTQARGWLLAHLPGIPVDSLLGQVLHQRFPGHQWRRQNSNGQTVVPFNVLSLSIAALAIAIFVVGIIGMLALAIPDPWPTLITLVWLVFVIAGSVFAYRMTASWYFRVVRPWLWMHLGPFDVPCRMLLLWLAIGIVVPLLANLDAPGIVWLGTAIVFLPLALLLVRWGRLVLSSALSELPTWHSAGARLRQALVGGGSLDGDLTLDGSMRVLGSTWAALPSMIAAAVLVFGVASCPAWVPERAGMYFVAFNAWSAPWVISALVIHARLLHWHQKRDSWWTPIKILAWCMWIPALPWFATMILLWVGYAKEPAGMSTGISALFLAFLLPVVIGRWARRR